VADCVDYKVGSAFLVPAQLAEIAKVDGFVGADLSNLRAIICAGAPVPPALIRSFMEKGINIQQAWGLTETAPFATYLPAERTLSKLGSCGIPMPHTEVRVVDIENGETIKEPGVSGELCVKGPNVAVGYWNNPEITQTAYLGGWFHTDDIGYFDEDGYYYVVDRLKDMIITGGENVYPAEVERILAEDDSFARCAVVSELDDRWGEKVVAVIQRSDDSDITLERVREHCSRHLARYKLPSKIVLIDEIPRNSAGKIDRLYLRKAVREGTIGEVVG